jgi:hypothetical protein
LLFKCKRGVPSSLEATGFLLSVGPEVLLPPLHEGLASRVGLAEGRIMRDDGPGVGVYILARSAPDCEGVSLLRETLERMGILVGARDGPDSGVGQWCLGACNGRPRSG